MQQTLNSLLNTRQHNSTTINSSYLQHSLAANIVLGLSPSPRPLSGKAQLAALRQQPGSEQMPAPTSRPRPPLHADCPCRSPTQHLWHTLSAAVCGSGLTFVAAERAVHLLLHLDLHQIRSSAKISREDWWLQSGISSE